MIDIKEARKHLEAMTPPDSLSTKDVESLLYMRNHFAEMLDEIERLREEVNRAYNDGYEDGYHHGTYDKEIL